MRRCFLPCCFSGIASLPNINNTFLFKVGLGISILDMAWMFALPFTTQTASYNKSWLAVLPSPSLTLLCPQTLSGLALLASAEYFAAVVLLWPHTRWFWLHIARSLETSLYCFSWFQANVVKISGRDDLSCQLQNLYVHLVYIYKVATLLATITCVFVDYLYDMPRGYLLIEDQFGHYWIYYVCLILTWSKSKWSLMSVESYWKTSMNIYDLIPDTCRYIIPDTCWKQDHGFYRISRYLCFWFPLS